MKSSNGLTDRVGTLGDRAKDRMTESRMSKLDRENTKLRTEVDLLRDELEDDRGALRDAIGALQRRPKRTPRRGGVLKTLVVAGVAYVIGTRAGRERYEQIRHWTRSTIDAAKHRADGDRQEEPGLSR